ncbi:MAG: ABC transporter permease subunit [Oligoflexia bacterium]|nr:ABC transporter permease subunit [Oligoflexia bacterium]
MAFQLSIPRRLLSVPDIFIFLLIGASIYALTATGELWQADYQPVTEIDLSVSALPRYALFSAMRGLAAYLISLTYTLIVGYWAARSKAFERVFIPITDILQSIPVLGFLPGLVIGLIAVFPRTNMGLEIAAIIMIFTSQAWNMVFSFYNSLKSIPEDYLEAAKMMGFNAWDRFWRLEMPFAATGLAWNSLISMAGGWFFLSICEAFTLGDRQFRLPGIGAYMAVAINQGNGDAIIYGIVAMLSLIIVLDFLIWHPILSWVRRFRLEETPGNDPTEPLMLLVLKESRIIRWIRYLYRRYIARREFSTDGAFSVIPIKTLPQVPQEVKKKLWSKSLKYVAPVLWIVLTIILINGSIKLIQTLSIVPFETWLRLLKNTSFSFIRIAGAVTLCALWAIPVGIWIGLSAKRIRIAQPIIQLLASFPAPMLYPLVLGIFLQLGVNFEIVAMILMFLAVQWYVLFNVLAGALKISRELNDTLVLINTTRKERWKLLYLPSVFPALVPGLAAATGGSWNASIVAEYIVYKGKVFAANGLGAEISIAASNANFPVLAASLTIMVVVVVLLNRTLWAYLYKLSQTRYRMDI